MKNRVSVAVTGGIGSGKSLVIDILKKIGYTTFSCDDIYRDLSFNKEYLFDEKISLLKKLSYKIIKKEREIFAKDLKKTNHRNS